MCNTNNLKICNTQLIINKVITIRWDKSTNRINIKFQLNMLKAMIQTCLLKNSTNNTCNKCINNKLLNTILILRMVK